jgi:hypothetical protein
MIHTQWGNSNGSQIEAENLLQEPKPMLEHKTGHVLGALKNLNRISGNWDKRTPRVGELAERQLVAGLLSRRPDQNRTLAADRTKRQAQKNRGGRIPAKENQLAVHSTDQITAESSGSWICS